MAMNSKKGVIFSIVALIFTIFLFSFTYISIHGISNYSQESDTLEKRVEAIDDSIKYYREVYLDDSMTYSGYKTLINLVEEDLDGKINGSHPKMQEFFSEGVLNATFDGDNIDSMKSEGIYFNSFYNNFKENFRDEHRGNFSHEINNIEIYEKNPYYVEIKFESVYNISVIEENQEYISWDFREEEEITIPLYDIILPEFYRNEGENVLLKPAEYYRAIDKWNRDELDDTIENSYSYIYSNNHFNYPIGDSYLSRVLNESSRGALKDVESYLRFENDRDNLGVFDEVDSSTNQSTLLGKTKMRFDFSEEFYTQENNKIKGLTGYRNEGEVEGQLSCLDNECNFDGVENYLEVEDFFSSNVDEMSLATKVGPNNLDDDMVIFSSEVFELSINSGIINLSVSSQGQEYDLEGEQIEGNKESLVITLEDDKVKLYQEGNLVDEGNLTTGGLKFNNKDFVIGKDFGNENKYYNGSIDYVNYFDVEVEENFIEDLYVRGRGDFYEYRESKFGEKVKLRNEDKVIVDNLSLKEDFSVEIWFNSKNLTNGKLFSIQDLLKVGFDNNQVYLEGDNVDDSVFGVSLRENKSNYLGLSYAENDLIVSLNGEVIGNRDDVDELDELNDELNIGYNFSGFLDLVKFYNRSMEEKDLINNYYNFEGYSGYCCNFLTLVSPNDFGYNESEYERNVSYSSSLFYENLNEDYTPDISLFSIENITSRDKNERNFNFLVDACLADAFHIFDLEFYSNNGTTQIEREGELDRGNEGEIKCRNLIEEGIY